MPQQTQQTQQSSHHMNGGSAPRYVVLMRDALQHGWDSQKAAQALKSRILRDERYLAYRRRSGLHNATDDAIEADLYALAWAACYLEEGIRDLDEVAPPNERGRMPSE
jgi:hypothetical protein